MAKPLRRFGLLQFKATGEILVVGFTALAAALYSVLRLPETKDTVLDESDTAPDWGCLFRVAIPIKLGL